MSESIESGERCYRDGNGYSGVANPQWNRNFQRGPDSGKKATRIIAQMPTADGVGK